MGIQSRTFRANRQEKTSFNDVIKNINTRCSTAKSTDELDAKELAKKKAKEHHDKIMSRGVKNSIAFKNRDYDEKTHLYRVANFRKESYPIYKRTLDELKRAGHPLGTSLHIEKKAHMHGKPLPGYYALLGRAEVGGGMLNVGPFWRTMFLLKERISEGLMLPPTEEEKPISNKWEI